MTAVWVGIYSGVTGGRAEGYLEDKNSFLYTFGNPAFVDQFREIMRIAKEEGLDRWLGYHIGTQTVIKRLVKHGLAGEIVQAWALLSHLLWASALDYDLDAYAAGVDRVLRTETLEQDFNELLRSVGHTPHVAIERINVSEHRKPFQSYYSPRSKRLVEKRCRHFLKAYGYSF